MKRQSVVKLCSSAFALISMFMLLFGCSGDNGAAGTSTGTVSGAVTSSLTGVPVAGATITTSPAMQAGTPITTDANGNYTMNLPVGVYQVTVAKTNYTSQTASVSVTAGQTATNNVKLVPTAAAAVSIANAAGAPGSSVTVVPKPSLADGVTGTPTYTYTQVSGPALTLDTTTYPGSAVVTLPSSANAKLMLATVAGMRIGEFNGGDTAAPTTISGEPFAVVVPQTGAVTYNAIPSTGFGAYMAPFEKVMVQSLTNHDISDGVSAVFQVTMTVGSYTATDTFDVNVKLPAVPNGGMRNVPIGQPVILNAPTQSAYSWTVTSAPAGSKVTTATLNDATSRNPDFIPDLRGEYVVNEATAGSITIYAGTWQGAIAGQDQYGPTIGNPGCGTCHQGTDPEVGKFTRSWNKSGHAHIVTGLPSTLPGGPTVQNISDPHGHWSAAGCGPCHTVGFAQYSTAIKANGFSETYRAEGLKITFGPNAWTQTLANYPKSASQMNIQCENCHGPSNSDAHGTSAQTVDPRARVNRSSATCGTCHGEPTRHGRYQEWAPSAHGDYELAQSEGGSASCTGCHTYQGFEYLNSQLKGTSTTPAFASRTLTSANYTAEQADIALDGGAQPQNCVTCHSPHNPGTKSGLTGSIVGLAGYDATYGTTYAGTTPLLPGGFQGNGVGRGALCMVCHNSRNGEPVSGAGNPTLHEDGDVNFGTLTAYKAPHSAAQGDVLMGRNAYFVDGVRSKHSFITDTCVTCHMELTAAPAAYDGAGFGTNHNFGADPAICVKCHGNAIPSADALQTAFDDSMTTLNTAIVNAITRVYYKQTGTVVDPSAVVIGSSHGSPTVTVSGTSYVPTDANALNIIAKALWNMNLLANDSSEGVHNPTFSFDVINATIKQVNLL